FDIVEDKRYERKFSNFLGWLRVKSSVFLIKKIGQLADGIVVISSYLDKRIKEIVGSKIEISLIPITVNFKHFPQKSKRTDPSNVKIFYGGSFFLGKDGVEYLLEAFNVLSKKYSTITLLLSGKS